jgi:oxidase EvaA
VTNLAARSALLIQGEDLTIRQRVAHSALAAEGSMMTVEEFHAWFARHRRRVPSAVHRIDFDELVGWSFQPGTGNLAHDSGRFFSIEGVRAQVAEGPIREWTQPIINQPEIGILGILLKEFDGVLHCLMQAKMEPGNINVWQLSPTVQATKSNYTRVHGGSPVPYLDYFRAADPGQVVADVLQSEQGSWFYRKRNRNIVVETTQDVEVLEGFCWLSIGQLHRLLAIDDLINMDSRTVLSCLPFSGLGFAPSGPIDQAGPERFATAVVRSVSENGGSLHSAVQVLSWITEVRARTEVRTVGLDLAAVVGWTRHQDRISHTSGAFFDVMAVRVEAGGREVAGWTQPMIEPFGTGLIAFIVQRIGGVVHVLVNARVEPGYLDVIELAPTVQCTPENYRQLPAQAEPPFLAQVLRAPDADIRFDAMLSEEGGRMFRASNRYLIVETPGDQQLQVPDDFRWVTLHQLVALIRHSHYVNVQARSLTLCLHSLIGGWAP